MSKIRNAGVLCELSRLLSSDRLATYESAIYDVSPPDRRTLNLYLWNAKVSAAFLLPLHFCEVSVRNAVCDALTNTFGPSWPHHAGFQSSLPSPAKGFQVRKELKQTAQKFATTGKIVAELKFAFWQQMFTSRYQADIWDRHMKSSFPGFDSSLPLKDRRTRIYDNLRLVRELRNRVAHHEPIFRRDLLRDLRAAIEVMEWRSESLANFVVENEAVSQLLKQPKLGDPTHEEISTFAYRLWQKRSEQTGSAQQDWATAEMRWSSLCP